MAGMSDCNHPDEQLVRTIYYTMCGACQQILIVTYCNYPKDCHADCTLASACVQTARDKFHKGKTLTVPPDMLVAARARIESRNNAE